MIEGEGRYIPEDIELLKDGTGFALNQAVTWKTEKDRLFIIHPDLAIAFNYKLTGSRLDLTNDYGEMFIYISKFGGPSPIVGAWVLVSFFGEPVTYEYWMEYNKDGTRIDSNGDNCKWFADSDFLYEILDSSKYKQRYQIKSGTLTLTGDDGKEDIIELKKK